jgi:two-component system sensor histidine kinase YcbA
MAYSKLKKLLFIALLVSLGARLYVSFFIPGFIITFTAIILGLALYFNEDVHPLTLGFVVALISPGMRFMIESFAQVDKYLVFQRIYPDAFFYIAYGMIFYGLRNVSKEQWEKKYYLILFFADFGSNLVELLVRTQFYQIKWTMIQGIIYVAIGRTFITMLTIFVVDRYTSLMMNKEHQKRYRYLMMLSSRFKSEIYILHKNMNQIEDLMGLSHKIKRMASENDALRDLSLQLSKDVHEIKKDYIRAVQGLEEIYDGSMDLEALSLKDLFTILDDNTGEYLKGQDLKVLCFFKCKANVMVKEHFYLMSILRNLLNNGIEACKETGKVSLVAEKHGDTIEIIVSDTGSGIASEDRPYIFNTGYSTKFSKETGDIYRGIGLTLVKDLVEDIFDGQLTYQSTPGQGTQFTISINENILIGGRQ